MENYEKKYNDLITRLLQARNDENKRGYTFCSVIDSLVPELKESEDEKIRKAIIEFFELQDDNTSYSFISKKDILAWLEKQKDYVSPQMVADAYLRGCNDTENKLFKKQGEKKPAIEMKTAEESLGYTSEEYNKIVDECIFGDKSKFHPGDWIVIDGETLHIKSVDNNGYHTDENGFIPFKNENKCHLWSIEDARAGDVLIDKYSKDKIIILYKGINPNLSVLAYCGWNGYNLSIKTNGLGYGNLDNTKYVPATKEQRDLLFSKMHEAGYAFDFKKKELKKIEDEEYNGEDYGIDSLYHAQRILEKTLGKVEGYQTDDGILSHQCAISAVKKLYEQKPVEWSEKDEKEIKQCIDFLNHPDLIKATPTLVKNCKNWLKSLRPQKQ